MTCAECLPGDLAPRSERRAKGRPASPRRGIRRAFQDLWRAYWRRRAERAMQFVLQSLDDRTLKDIGIDRSEIDPVIYGARDWPTDRRCPAAFSRAEERRIAMRF
jgi:uncharacterized protein YjiS (DUF1127 family)